MNYKCKKKSDYSLTLVYFFCIAIVCIIILSTFFPNKYKKKNNVVPTDIKVVTDVIKIDKNPIAPKPIDKQKDAPKCCDKVVVFTATLCGACKNDKPSLEKAIRSGVKVTVYDYDTNTYEARQYKITSLPTYLIYKGCKLEIRTNNVNYVLKLIKK